MRLQPGQIVDVEAAIAGRGHENVIDVSGLAEVLRRGASSVDHIALRVGAGEIVGFLGPNGWGKTTTIRMICGLLTPDAGRTCLGFDFRGQIRKIKRGSDT